MPLVDMDSNEVDRVPLTAVVNSEVADEEPLSNRLRVLLPETILLGDQEGIGVLMDR